jgi:hypothetical protein
MSETKTKPNGYLIYYQNEDGDKMYIPHTRFAYLKTNKEMKAKNGFLPQGVNYFSMLGKKHEASESGLKEYIEKFLIWKAQLLKYKIVYTYFYNDNMATLMFLRSKLPDGVYQFLQDNPIDQIEHNYMENCKRGGLQKCIKGHYNSHSVDFVSHYPRCLSSDDFKFPLKEGYEWHLKKIPKSGNLLMGYYRIILECDDPNFDMVFTRNDSNWYDYYSILFLKELKKDYGMDIKIRMDVSDDPNEYVNCYLFDNEHLISGDKCFGKWFDYLMKIKYEYPDNALIKNMMSTIWGILSERIRLKLTAEEFEEANENIVFERYDETREKYICYDKNKIYKHNFRIKVFLTSYARNKTAIIALRDIENCVRIHTDGITFKNQLPDGIIESGILEREIKTTGNIIFINVNTYYKEKDEKSLNKAVAYWFYSRNNFRNMKLRIKGKDCENYVFQNEKDEYLRQARLPKFKEEYDDSSDTNDNDNDDEKEFDIISNFEDYYS